MNEQTGLFINSVPEPPAPAAPPNKDARVQCQGDNQHNAVGTWNLN